MDFYELIMKIMKFFLKKIASSIKEIFFSKKTTTIHSQIAIVCENLNFHTNSRNDDQIIIPSNKPKSIAFVGLNGGEGKTTLATLLAQYLGKDEKQILYINTDELYSNFFNKISNLNFCFQNQSNINTLNIDTCSCEYIIIDAKTDVAKVAAMKSDVILIPIERMLPSNVDNVIDFVEEIKILRKNLEIFVVFNRILDMRQLRSAKRQLQMRGISFLESCITSRAFYIPSFDDNIKLYARRDRNAVNEAMLFVEECKKILKAETV